MQKKRKEIKRTAKSNKGDYVYSKGFGIAGFVLGLISIPAAFTLIFGIILGILGIVFSILQFKRQKTGLSIAGLILSIIGILLSLIILLSITVLLFSGVPVG